MRIDSSGNVGIGTTAINARLDIDGAGGSPATSGTTQNGVVRIRNANNNNCLDMGQIAGSPFGSWLQATDVSDLSAKNTLYLNPNGGSVGIGAFAPSTTQRLSIYGDGSSKVGGIEFRNAPSGGATITVGHVNATSPSALINVVESGNLILSTDDTEAARIDASQNFLVASQAAGSVSGDGVIVLGGRGIIVENSVASLANNGTLDIAINTGGGGYQGFLLVSNTVSAAAGTRTQSTFSVFGRSTDSSIQQIATDNGPSAAASFTVTTPSNGLIRVTNTSGNACHVAMQFFGGNSL